MGYVECGLEEWVHIYIYLRKQASIVGFHQAVKAASFDRCMAFPIGSWLFVKVLHTGALCPFFCSL